MGGQLTKPSNKHMVDRLVERQSYIHTAKVEGVFRAVDRAMYFDLEEGEHIDPYEDDPWRRGNLHLSAPCIYAKVVEALDLHPGMSFLNMGSGTGYLNTLVGLLIGPNGRNLGVEFHKDVVEYAYKRLEQFKRNSCAMDKYDFSEPSFIRGNCLNVDPNIRYDRVYLGAACLPDMMMFMMKLVKPDGGIIVMPYENHLMRHVRISETEWRSDKLMDVNFTLMIGRNQPQYDANGQQIQYNLTESERLLEMPANSAKSLKELCRIVIRQKLRQKTDLMNPDLLNSDNVDRRRDRRALATLALRRLDQQVYSPSGGGRGLASSDSSSNDSDLESLPGDLLGSNSTSDSNSEIFMDATEEHADDHAQDVAVDEPIEVRINESSPNETWFDLRRRRCERFEQPPIGARFEDDNDDENEDDDDDESSSSSSSSSNDEEEDELGLAAYSEPPSCSLACRYRPRVSMSRSTKQDRIAPARMTAGRDTCLGGRSGESARDSRSPPVSSRLRSQKRIHLDREGEGPRASRRTQTSRNVPSMPRVSELDDDQSSSSHAMCRIDAARKPPAPPASRFSARLSMQSSTFQSSRIPLARGPFESSTAPNDDDDSNDLVASLRPSSSARRQRPTCSLRSIGLRGYLGDQALGSFPRRSEFSPSCLGLPSQDAFTQWMKRKTLRFSIRRELETEFGRLQTIGSPSSSLLRSQRQAPEQQLRRTSSRHRSGENSAAGARPSSSRMNSSRETASSTSLIDGHRDRSAVVERKRKRQSSASSSSSSSSGDSASNSSPSSESNSSSSGDSSLSASSGSSRTSDLASGEGATTSHSLRHSCRRCCALRSCCSSSSTCSASAGGRSTTSPKKLNSLLLEPVRRSHRSSSAAALSLLGRSASATLTGVAASQTRQAAAAATSVCGTSVAIGRGGVRSTMTTRVIMLDDEDEDDDHGGEEEEQEEQDVDMAQEEEGALATAGPSAANNNDDDNSAASSRSTSAARRLQASYAVNERPIPGSGEMQAAGQGLAARDCKHALARNHRCRHNSHCHRHRHKHHNFHCRHHHLHQHRPSRSRSRTSATAENYHHEAHNISRECRSSFNRLCQHLSQLTDPRRLRHRRLRSQPEPLQQQQHHHHHRAPSDRLRDLQRCRRRVERERRFKATTASAGPDRNSLLGPSRGKNGERGNHNNNNNKRVRTRRRQDECEKYRSHMSAYIKLLPLPRVLHDYLNYGRQF